MRIAALVLAACFVTVAAAPAVSAAEAPASLAGGASATEENGVGVENIIKVGHHVLDDLCLLLCPN